MKTFQRLFLLAAAASPAALILFGCSKTDNTSATVDKVQADAKAVVADVKTAASDSWDGIKDYTYEKRSDFSSGIDRMSKQMDDKTAELKTKMAGATDDASAARASAMKEYDAARVDLNSKLSDLGNATADTWADAKAKVAQSWNRVQAAFERVKTEIAS
jgi:hypothetical protein